MTRLATGVWIVGGLLATMAVLFAIAGGFAAPAYSAQDRTPTPHVIEVIIRWSDGQEDVYPLATAADTATATPTATATDSPTPLPSDTPTATATVTNTPEPLDTATPTQEIPTPVPTFTVTPAPPVTECIAGAVVALRYRDAPSIDGQQLGTWSRGTSLVVERMVVVSDAGTEWWYVHSVEQPTRAGWSAAFYNGAQHLALFDELDPNCLPPVMPIEYKQDPLPATPVARGIHISDGVPQSVIAEIAPYVDLVKVLPLSAGNLGQYKAYRPDGIGLYRDTRAECPARWEVYSSPEVYAQRLVNLWDDANLYSVTDWFEIMNECQAFHGTDDYAALAEFLIAVAEQVNDQRGVCILAGSFGPGNPEIAEFVALYPFFEWALAHPCQRGRYHGIATHATGYMPSWVDTTDWPWVGNIWIAGRHRLYNNELMIRHGFDLLASPLPWFTTELGFTYGYSEDPGGFSCQEKRAGIQETTRVYATDGLEGFAKWNICNQCGPWQNDIACLPGMFQ